MAKLTKKEKAWVAEVNKILAACPSKRLMFATVGDCDVYILDHTKYDATCDEQETNKGEFVSAAERIGALFDEVLKFPGQVESTAG